MSDKEVKLIAKNYADKLKAEKFDFSAIYLFDSHVKGIANNNSDIDIAVVSDKLKRNWNKNEDKLWRYAFRVDSRIEPIGFSVEDFNNNNNPIACAIKTTGVKVA